VIVTERNRPWNSDYNLVILCKTTHISDLIVTEMTLIFLHTKEGLFLSVISLMNFISNNYKEDVSCFRECTMNEPKMTKKMERTDKEDKALLLKKYYILVYLISGKVLDFLYCIFSASLFSLLSIFQPKQRKTTLVKESYLRLLRVIISTGLPR
jgi:DNA-binding transcriptional regulator WhiA